MAGAADWVLVSNLYSDNPWLRGFVDSGNHVSCTRAKLEQGSGTKSDRGCWQSGFGVERDDQFNGASVRQEQQG